METTVQFTPTREEFVRASRFFLIASRTVNPFYFVLLGAYLLFSVFLLFWFGVTVMTVVSFVVSAAAGLFYAYVYLIRPAKKYDKTPGLQQMLTLRLGEAGLGYYSSDRQYLVKWESYHCFWENESFFLMTYGTGKFHFIPKRIFGSAQEQKEFSSRVLALLPAGAAWVKKGKIKKEA